MLGPPVLFKLGIKVNFGQVIKDKSHFSEDWEVRERFGEVRERFRRGSGEVGETLSLASVLTKSFGTERNFSAYKKLRY